MTLLFQLSSDLSQEIAPICKKMKGVDFGMDTPLSPTNSETGESLFELYLAVQEFVRFVLINLLVEIAFKPYIR